MPGKGDTTSKTQIDFIINLLEKCWGFYKESTYMIINCTSFHIFNAKFYSIICHGLIVCITITSFFMSYAWMQLWMKWAHKVLWYMIQLQMSLKNYMKCCTCIHDDKCLTLRHWSNDRLNHKGSMVSIL